MNSAVNFLLESGISLSLLSLVYILFLRKETFFMSNRLFLLFSVVFSLVLPLIRLHVFEPHSVVLSEITISPYRNLIETVTVYGKDFTFNLENAILSTQFLIIIYLIGFSFFLVRFYIKIHQLFQIINQNRIEKKDGYKLVIMTNKSTPFSFLNYLFANPQASSDPDYQKILDHELEHIRQGHTIDILCLELLTVFQWCNPFVWMLKKAIRENHEYLADQSVLSSGISLGKYKYLLLKQTIGVDFPLANHFNTSLVKKRIKMISKIKSKKYAYLKFSFGIMIAASLITIFACEQKELLSQKTTQNSETLQVVIEDGKLKMEGMAEAIEKVKELFTGNSGFDVQDNGQKSVILVRKDDSVRRFLKEGEFIFRIAEKMPVFLDDEQTCQQFISNSLRYPVEAQTNSIKGKVYVSFVVSKDGFVANCKIARSVHPLLDNEALRVVNSMPKWTPGYEGDKPVNVHYTIPINFVLN